MKPLRQTAGTIASTVYGMGGSATWPQLIASVSTFLQSPEEAACDGGLDLLFKLIEDHFRELDSPMHPGGPSACAQLLPLLLKLMQSPFTSIRGQSLACLNLLVKASGVGLARNEKGRFRTKPSPAFRLL